MMQWRKDKDKKKEKKHDGRREIRKEVEGVPLSALLCFALLCSALLCSALLYIHTYKYKPIPPTTRSSLLSHSIRQTDKTA